MAFAKFNLCSPCCTNTAVCHPYTVVNIMHPKGHTATPTPVDLWAGLSSLYTEIGCSVQTAIHPSGGIFEGVFPTNSSIVPCPVPWDDFFNLDHDYGVFTSGYQNGSLIDLNTTITRSGSSAAQRFDVPRHTGANPTHCYSPLYYPGCPCYEVSGNRSSAWGSITYQIYPNEYFQGCSSGQYFNNNPYLDCTSIYNICSADICNGTGIDKHQAINLPYCLTKVNASIYDIAYFNNGIGGGIPEFVATYNNENGIGACLGWFNTNMAIISTCYSATGVVYQRLYKPNIVTSGCNTYYLQGADTTRLLMDWSDVSRSTSTPSNYCSAQTRKIVFDCQDSLINVCGVNDFSPTVLSDKTGYPAGSISCAVENSCPDCDILSTNYSHKGTFASTPLTCDVSLSYPNTGGQLSYNGTLTLENWNPLGAKTWVPNPFTIPCGSSFVYNSAYQANAQTVPLTYQGYQLTRCFTVGVGSLYSTTCYENEINYGLIYATCVDMSCTPPVVNLNGLYKYHPSDTNNACVECCESDGTPNGTLDCSGGGSCLNGIVNCNRPASPSPASLTSTLWQTQSCCELYASFLNSGNTNWNSYCNLAGRPECEFDGSPLSVQTPSSGNLVSDPCNDILSYSLYDVNGELIYTVSI